MIIKKDIQGRVCPSRVYIRGLKKVVRLFGV